MGLYQKMEKRLQVQFVSAQTDALLSRLASAGVVVWNVKFCDLLTVKVWIRNSDYGKFQALMESTGTQYRVIKRNGALWRVSKLLKRPVLAIGLVLFLMIALWLPSRILFVDVEGNQTIPTRLILEKAHSCGITFGSSRRDVRSEKTKNELLSEIPQLQWVGINTSGCIAKISVKEASVVHRESEGAVVSAIVAARDGIIERIVTLRGTAMCTVGQTVEQGDILISGYTDCGLKVTAESAQGEVFAYTHRNLQLLAMKPTAQKGEVTGKQVNYRLRIGKKVINLWNDSGISDTTCDKMYVEEYWTLPGRFQLPVSVIRETCTYYADQLDADSGEDSHEPWLAQFAQSYLSRQMAAGSILAEKTSYRDDEDCNVFTGEYACLEMIGKVRYEETLEKHAKDN